MIRRIFFILIGFIWGCEDYYAPVIEKVENNNLHKSGVIILNEGNYNFGNASVTLFNTDNQKVENHAFLNANNRNLGDVAQSVCLFDSVAFILVNNSKKIEIVNRYTFKSIKTVQGLTSPRYMHIVDNTKAYITDLYDEYVKIFNPSLYSITDSIYTGCSTENMLQYANEIFVANWSFGNKILVINTQSDQIIDTVVVTKEPNSMVLDKDNKIWVLSSGGFLNEEIPAMTCIDAQSHSIDKIMTFSDKTMNPSRLCYDRKLDYLYFINKDVYRMSVTDVDIPTTAFVEAGGNILYAMNINPDNSNIYVSNAKNFNEAGEILIYNADGMKLSEFEAGIIPGYIEFGAK